jgi:hypothetical protein
VDWPVTIVITQEALKIYAEIFGYLSQIRFSMFSLTHTWNFLKVCFSPLPTFYMIFLENRIERRYPSVVLLAEERPANMFISNNKRPFLCCAALLMKYRQNVFFFFIITHKKYVRFWGVWVVIYTLLMLVGFC